MAIPVTYLPPILAAFGLALLAVSEVFSILAAVVLTIALVAGGALCVAKIEQGRLRGKSAASPTPDETTSR